MTRPSVPRLHLIGPLDGVVLTSAYPDIVASAIRGGVDAVHVRMPEAYGGDVLSLASAIRSRMNPGSGSILVVNDRIDVSLLAAAGGVHLGERSVSVSDARSLVGRSVLIGRSVHDFDGAIQAQRDGADYIIAGHVFETDSKRGEPGRGLDWLSEVTRSVSIPVIAIGGIRIERIEDVMMAGAWGVAVGREVLGATDPEATSREIRSRIERKRLV